MRAYCRRLLSVVFPSHSVYLVLASSSAQQARDWLKGTSRCQMTSLPRRLPVAVLRHHRPFPRRHPPPPRRRRRRRRRRRHRHRRFRHQQKQQRAISRHLPFRHWILNFAAFQWSQQKSASILGTACACAPDNQHRAPHQAHPTPLGLRSAAALLDCS